MTILTSVRWNPTAVLICISLIINDLKHLVTCLLPICMSSTWRNVYWGLLVIFLTGLLMFLLLSCMSSYILEFVPRSFRISFNMVCYVPRNLEVEGGMCQRPEYTWGSAGDVCSWHEYCERHIKGLGLPEEGKCASGWNQAVNTDNLTETWQWKRRGKENGTSREKQR